MLKRTLLALLALLVLLLVAFAAGPRTEGPAPLRAVALPDGLRALEDGIAAAEAAVDGLRPGTEKTIVWADSARPARTPVALVYVHGFTASRGETAPLADTVAARLGANLFYTRLTGHGRDADAMGEATLPNWLRDVHEAYRIGERLGERVVLMGTSMGGALITWLASQPGVDPLAVVLISPAYGLYDAAAEAQIVQLARLPWGEVLVRSVAGAYRGAPSEEAAINRYWTTRYRSDALLPLGRLVEALEAADPSAFLAPLFIAYSRQDRVVDPAAIEARFEAAGSAYKDTVRIERSGDPNHHVLAGRHHSPETVLPLADAVVAFLRPLL